MNPKALHPPPIHPSPLRSRHLGAADEKKGYRALEELQGQLNKQKLDIKTLSSVFSRN
jgi:hypothetical protein